MFLFDVRPILFPRIGVFRHSACKLKIIRMRNTLKQPSVAGDEVPKADGVILRILLEEPCFVLRQAQQKLGCFHGFSLKQRQEKAIARLSEVS